MAARGRKESEREALHRLVTRLNAASRRRETAARGTGEYREADEVARRYRRILLDDDLFARFVKGDLDPESLASPTVLPR